MNKLLVRNFLFIFPLFLLSFLFFFHQNAYATDNGQKLPAITIINPIRGNELGHEKDDLLSGLKTQWQMTKDAKVNATWLWQYSALENEDMVSFAKANMQNQEFGLFLEIDRNFAKKAGVQYRGQGPWYFSDGLLLISYDKSEREKLIDTVFSKFKKTFGYYPKTVGAWWIGADSLNYMQKKYGIVAAMRASDQFDLDVYSIWGTPWSIPYVASKNDEGKPANSFNDSSKVVMLQWAPRDPTRGYADFAYSVQDFTLRDDNFSYVNYLTSIFLRKPLDNIVIGLENSGSSIPLEVYYAKIIKKAYELEKNHQARIILAKDYAQEFLVQKNIFANSSQVKFFLSKDYKSDDQSFWYNSPNFRTAIIKTGDNIYLVDLRDYTTRTNEDFLQLPNAQGYLRISEPAVIDTIRFPDSKVLIAKSSGSMNIEQNGDEVTIFANNAKIAKFTSSSLKLYLENKKTKNFLFKQKFGAENIFYILLTIFILYGIIIYLHKRNLWDSLVNLLVLLIPLLVAYPYLNNGFNNVNFIFDRKELFLLNFLVITKLWSVISVIILSKIVPFILLITGHYFLTILNEKKIYKFGSYVIFSLALILYAHVEYFPLDRSTYPMLFAICILIFLLLVSLVFLIWKKTRNKKLLIGSLIIIPFILALLGGIIYISRTKIILTQFENDALKVIETQHKDVLFVSENNYNIKPIYKAVKPMLYEDYHLGERLTGTHWQIVFRPDNNILKVSNYDGKLIVVPRYLGADLSEKEMQLLNLKKIFDNAQIAIFEKK